MREDTLSRRGRTGGYALIEIMLAITCMVAVLGSFALVTSASQGLWILGDTRSSLQDVASRVLADVLEDLRRSGLSTAGGVSFPLIRERPRGPEGTPSGVLIATMDYTDIDMVDETLAYQGTGDRIQRNQAAVSREIVFQLPADLDGNGLPVDDFGAVEWSPDLHSYRVIVEPNGTPWLYRHAQRPGGAVARERVGPFVQSITFDVVFNDLSLRFNEIAVVVYLQKRNSRGQLITAAIEGSVTLRNTEEL